MENEIVVSPTEQQIHEIAIKSTPVKLIEESLANFLNDTFTMAREEDDFQKQLKAAIVTKLPDMKASELIALATSASTNRNDMLSKLISPTMQLLTAAQQNELAAKKELAPQYNQTNIKEINTQAPTDVLQGLAMLFNLAKTVEKKEAELLTASSTPNV